jgi:hypothetical protein
VAGTPSARDEPRYPPWATGGPAWAARHRPEAARCRHSRLQRTGPVPGRRPCSQAHGRDVPPAFTVTASHPRVSAKTGGRSPPGLGGLRGVLHAKSGNFLHRPCTAPLLRCTRLRQSPPESLSGRTRTLIFVTVSGLGHWASAQGPHLRPDRQVLWSGLNHFLYRSMVPSGAGSCGNLGAGAAYRVSGLGHWTSAQGALDVFGSHPRAGCLASTSPASPLAGNF